VRVDRRLPKEPFGVTRKVLSEVHRRVGNWRINPRSLAYPEVVLKIAEASITRKFVTFIRHRRRCGPTYWTLWSG